jgi:hypothetical protein
MEVLRLPALSDNYIFLLYDASSGTAAVVDPAEAEPVLAELRRLGARLAAAAIASCWRPFRRRRCTAARRTGAGFRARACS